jgi:hypothetical protein
MAAMRPSAIALMIMANAFAHFDDIEIDLWPTSSGAHRCTGWPSGQRRKPLARRTSGLPRLTSEITMLAIYTMNIKIRIAIKTGQKFWSTRLFETTLHLFKSYTTLSSALYSLAYTIALIGAGKLPCPLRVPMISDDFHLSFNTINRFL